MKSIYLTSIILLCILLPTVFATDIPNHYNDYVNDFSKIFSANQTAELESILTQVRADTTAEVVVVTVNNLSGDNIQEYSTRLATTWGIGKADKDNGLLILYAKTENKIWVASGYGIEGILPDSKIGRLLDDYYVPLRDKGNVNEGIISVTEQLVQVLEDNKAEIISGQTAGANSNTKSMAIIIIVVALFIFFIATIKLKSKKDNKKKKYGMYLNGLSILLLVIYFFSGLFIFLIIALLLMILLRIFGRNPSSPWFVPVGSMGGSGSSGGFSGGGGFGGGGFGGGGAGR